MQSRLDEFNATDARIFGISTDGVDSAAEAAEGYGIDFPLLSDPDLAAIDAFGLRHMDGGLEGDIARPATLILDREGRVVWRDLTDNWRVRPRPADLLEVLDTLD